MGSSAGDSRAASTAYGFRTPAVFAPVANASACGAKPHSSAAFTAESAGPLGPGQLPGVTEGREGLSRYALSALSLAFNL